MKKILFTLILATLTIIFTGCSQTTVQETAAHQHSFSEATCLKPAICTKCGETSGAALGHDWKEATYETPKTCSTCGATEGDVLEKPFPKTKFNNNYYTIYDYGSDGRVLCRGRLDNLKAYVDEQYDGTYKLELILKGEMVYTQYSGKWYAVYSIYIWDENYNCIASEEKEFTRMVEEGDEIAIYETFYDLPYSESYTIWIF